MPRGDYSGHLDLLLLSALQGRCLHGYGVIEHVRRASGGLFDYPEGTYCDGCLAKPWHVTATWPCGTEAPREIITQR